MLQFGAHSGASALRYMLSQYLSQIMQVKKLIKLFDFFFQICCLNSEICRNQMPDSFSYDPSSGYHRMAIIVPFRNRFEELQEFVPHMKKFLHNQSIANDIYVVNQVK